MNPLSRHYHQLVGLNQAWVIADVPLDVRNKTLTLPLEFVGDHVLCLERGATCSIKDHAAERSWRHLDAMQFQTVLTARIPRCSCTTCGVKTIAVPWAEKHSRFTPLFEAFAIDVLQASRSIQSAALLLGIDWSTAQVTMQRAVTRVLERRSVDEVTRVGIDQKSFGKRQDYVTVMTDIDESRVPEVTPDRTPESADIRWKTLSPKQRSQVRAVCMGMLQAYETSTETPAPKALIVHDSCHISKYLNEAVDKVRQAEHRELQQTGDDRLKGMRQTLLVAPENLSDEKNDELAALRQSTLATGRAWSIDRRFPQSPIGRATRMLKHRPYQMLKWCSSAITHIASEGSYNRIRASSPAATGLQLFDRCRIKRLF